MPTLRVPLNRLNRARITPDMVELYVRICEIIDSGADKAWEDAGGRLREKYDAEVELMAALGCNPWHYTPWHIGDAPQPRDDPERWQLADELRRLLDEAVAAKPPARRTQKRTKRS